MTGSRIESMQADVEAVDYRDRDGFRSRINVPRNTSLTGLNGL